jgi:hypothetical protein
MADATSVLTGLGSKVMQGGGSFISMMAWILIIIVLAGITLITTIFVIRFAKYKNKIILFEKIDNEWKITAKDRASEVKYGNADDRVWLTLKGKRMIPQGNFQVGKRVFWYFKRSDGEIENFKLKDLDEESKKAGAVFLHKDMRYARTQIQKGLKDRYDKPTFWDRYGNMIVNVTVVMIIIIGLWLLMDKWVDLAQITNNNAKDMGELQISVSEKYEELLSKMDLVCSGGSGYVEGT